MIQRIQRLETARTRKVVVADDDKEINQLMQMMLRRHGYTVFSALDGDEAIRLVQSEHPDVIILDLMMPRVSGFDVLEAIRLDRSLDDVEVVIMTAKSLTKQEMEDLRKRAGTIIEKGSRNLKEVLQIIRKKLEHMKEGAAS